MSEANNPWGEASNEAPISPLSASDAGRDRTRASVPQRSVEDMLTWEANRRAKLVAKAKEIEESNLRDVTGRPVISKKAENLSKRWKAADDSASVATGATGMSGDYMSIASSRASVADRLYDYSEVQRMKAQRAVEEAEVSAQQAAQPAIDGYSAHLAARRAERNGLTDLPTHLRLYVDTVGNEPSNHYTPVQHDENGQRLYTPQILPYKGSDMHRGERPVEEMLVEKGLIYQQRQAIREKNKLYQESQMRNKPKINPTSAKILHSSGKAQVDRLHQPIGRISNHTMSTMEKHTYKPQISSASREMLRGHHHAPAQNNIYNRNLAWEAAKQERIQHEQQCRLEDELAECSFAPRISGHAEDGRIDRGTGMVDRHYEWMQRRDEKLSLERQRRDEEANKDCTFIPKVEHPPGSLYRWKERSSSRGRGRSDESSGGSDGSRGRDSFSLNDLAEPIDAPYPAHPMGDLPPPPPPPAPPAYYSTDFNMLEQLAEHALFTSTGRLPLPPQYPHPSQYQEQDLHPQHQHPQHALPNGYGHGHGGYMDQDELSMSDAFELE